MEEGPGFRRLWKEGTAPILRVLGKISGGGDIVKEETTS